MSESVITYDELVMWRDICEWMSAHGGAAAAEQLIYKFGEAVTPLVSYDRTRRQVLWDEYKIQLIIWEREDRRYGCWTLKANWELKIHYLEEIVLLGKDPETTPKLYLEVLHKHQAERDRKAHNKRRKECFREINHALSRVYYDLHDLEFYTGAETTLSPITTLSPAFFQSYVERFRHRIATTRALLQEWREKFDDRPQPEPGSAVLGGKQRQPQPQPTDAVLGGVKSE